MAEWLADQKSKESSAEELLPIGFQPVFHLLALLAFG